MGVWHPDRYTLTAIREAIVEDAEGWTDVARARGFTDAFRLGGDSLGKDVNLELGEGVPPLLGGIVAAITQVYYNKHQSRGSHSGSHSGS